MSRKILLYISDAGFHFAGDGLVSSSVSTCIYVPNSYDEPRFPGQMHTGLFGYQNESH